MTHILSCFSRSKVDDSDQFSHNFFANIFKKELEQKEEEAKEQRTKTTDPLFANYNILVSQSSQVTQVSLPCLHQSKSQNFVTPADFSEIVNVFNKYTKAPQSQKFTLCNFCEIPSLGSIHRKDLEKFSLYFIKHVTPEIFKKNDTIAYTISSKFSALSLMANQLFTYCAKLSLSKLNPLNQITSETIREKIQKINDSDWSEWIKNSSSQLDLIKTAMLLPGETSKFDLSKDYKPKKYPSRFTLFSTKKSSYLSSITFSYQTAEIEEVIIKRKKNYTIESIIKKPASITAHLLFRTAADKDDFFSFITKAIPPKAMQNKALTIAKEMLNHCIVIKETVTFDPVKYPNKPQLPACQRLLGLCYVSHEINQNLYTILNAGFRLGDFSELNEYHESRIKQGLEMPLQKGTFKEIENLESELSEKERDALENSLPRASEKIIKKAEAIIPVINSSSSSESSPSKSDKEEDLEHQEIFRLVSDIYVS